MLTPEQYQRWDTYMAVIAELDWAVEGYPAPEGTTATREEAIITRNTLVKMASQIHGE